MVLVWQITDDLPNSPNFPAIWYLKWKLAALCKVSPLVLAFLRYTELETSKWYVFLNIFDCANYIAMSPFANTYSHIKSTPLHYIAIEVTIVGQINRL